jgi:predicted dehydrogenase
MATRIGLVGVGFIGMIHFLAARRLKGAQVTALCDNDPQKLTGDWRGLRGNFGPPGEIMDLSGIKKYDRVEALVADPDIDLVDVCTPTDFHKDAAITALKAGKHVLVEKPITLRQEDADAMVAAARQAGKLLMVAHVLPFFAEFTYALEAIRSGVHGKLLAAHFKRIICPVDWSAAAADPVRTGGPAVDLHIHDNHFIGLACGVPGQVFSTGVFKKDTVAFLTTQYLYGPGGPTVSCSSGDICQKGRPFVHGYELYFERATLLYESGAIPLTLLTADGKSEQPALQQADEITAFARELQVAVEASVSGKEPDLLRGQLARDALVMSYKECESVRTGKPVSIR